MPSNRGTICPIRVTGQGSAGRGNAAGEKELVIVAGRRRERAGRSRSSPKPSRRGMRARAERCRGRSTPRPRLPPRGAAVSMRRPSETSIIAVTDPGEKLSSLQAAVAGSGRQSTKRLRALARSASSQPCKQPDAGVANRPGHKQGVAFASAPERDWEQGSVASPDQGGMPNIRHPQTAGGLLHCVSADQWHTPKLSSAFFNPVGKKADIPSRRLR